jgi:1-deoxy-D-xylulose 5-phosphate reductoisomerase
MVQAKEPEVLEKALNYANEEVVYRYLDAVKFQKVKKILETHFKQSLPKGNSKEKIFS